MHLYAYSVFLTPEVICANTHRVTVQRSHTYRVLLPAAHTLMRQPLGRPNIRSNAWGVCMSSRACPSACLFGSSCQIFLALSLTWHRLLVSSRADTPSYPCNAAGLTCCRATCLPTVGFQPDPALTSGIFRP